MQVFESFPEGPVPPHTTAVFFAEKPEIIKINK